MIAKYNNHRYLKYFIMYFIFAGLFLFLDRIVLANIAVNILHQIFFYIIVVCILLSFVGLLLYLFFTFNRKWELEIDEDKIILSDDYNKTEISFSDIVGLKIFQKVKGGYFIILPSSLHLSIELSDDTHNIVLSNYKHPGQIVDAIMENKDRINIVSCEIDRSYWSYS